jgi:hypothetical protein
MKQDLVIDTAKVAAKWMGGGNAQTTHKLGKGYVYALGALFYTSGMKHVLKAVPWARGGRHTAYNPVGLKVGAIAVTATIPPAATSAGLKP